MIRLLHQVSVEQHTDRYFTLRHMEREAGASLADAIADVGDQLLQIQGDLPLNQPFVLWLAQQNDRAREEGLDPISDRRAREYMALAKFRMRMGERFALFLHIDPACLYPILGLAEGEIEQLLKNGVTTENGAAAPLETASRDEIRAAVASMKGSPKAPAVPTRAEQLQKLLKAIDSLGPLTEEEKRQVAAHAAISTAEVDQADAPAPRSSMEGVASGAAAPLHQDPMSEAGAAPPQVFTGQMGTVTMLGGRPVLGSLDRTALADDAVAAIQQATAKCAMVKNGSGTLAAGRKTKARSAVETLRLAVLGWPAMT